MVEQGIDERVSVASSSLTHSTSPPSSQETSPSTSHPSGGSRMQVTPVSPVTVVVQPIAADLGFRLTDGIGGAVHRGTVTVAVSVELGGRRRDRRFGPGGGIAVLDFAGIAHFSSSV